MANAKEKIDIHEDSQEEYAQPDLPVDRRGSVAVNVVENPLKRKSQAQVFEDAKSFAESNGMAEYSELFGQGALVARDPLLIHSLKELNDEQRAALAYEKDHKWTGSSSKTMWYTVILCAIGAATQGWDQTGSNGANLTFPVEFGLYPADGSTPDAYGFWVVGLVNAIIFLTAGLIGAWIVDPLNHYLGRKGEIFITAAGLTACPIGSAFTHSWQQLFAARFVLGIFIGAKNATVPIFSSEIAPARIRGALVMFWQLWVVMGIFLGLCANVIVQGSPIAWRLQLGSAFIPSFILLCGIPFVPESPRWLMKKGRLAEGFKSMSKIRSHSIIAARDYYYSYVLYQEELKLAAGAGYFGRLADCFRIPRIRRANYGASTVMFAQQLCGINIISFYSSSIFENVGYTPLQALYASLGYGAIQVLSTIPTLFLIDTKGRRRLCLIVSFVKPCQSLVNVAVAFQYSAEVFPNIQREQGMAFAVSINNFFAGVLSLTFPRMQAPDVMTPTGAFGFYAGLNLVAWLLIFCFVRETKQLTLEELDQVFSVPTSEFIRYEAKVRVPWFFKRYFLFRRDLVEPPVNIAKEEDEGALGGLPQAEKM